MRTDGNVWARARPFVTGAGLTAVMLLASPDARAEDLHPAFPELEQGEDVAETYDLNTFGIVHEEVSSPFAIVFGGVWWRPVRGKYRRALAYRDFYEALGRPDLADAQASKHFWCSVMIWGGLALEIAGGVLFFTGLSGGDFSTQSKIGLGMFAGGLVSGAVGASTDKPALSEEEALAMAREYNGALRTHLGLGEASSLLQARRSPFRVAVAPVLGRRAGGLSVRFAF